MNNNSEQDNKLSRIDIKYILGQFLNIFSIDKGFLYTIKSLLLQPGTSIRNFIYFDRKKMMKPLIFLTLCSAIFLLSAHWTGISYSIFELKSFTISGKKFETGKLSNWLNENVAYLNIIVAIYSSLWARLFFKNSGFNIYEIATAMFYIFGQTILILTFFILIYIPLNSYINSSLLIIPILIYTTFAIQKFFTIEKKLKFLNILKSVIVYFFGIFSHIIVIAGMAIATWILK